MTVRYRNRISPGRVLEFPERNPEIELYPETWERLDDEPAPAAAPEPAPVEAPAPASVTVESDPAPARPARRRRTTAKR